MKKDLHKKASGFIDKTLLGAIALLKETVSNEEIASRKGFLQGCDPRLKMLTIAILLVSVVSTRSILVLSIMYAVDLILAVSSSITIGLFLKRTLLFIPIFSLCIVLPAIFNAVTPGDPLLSFNLHVYTLSITRQGIDSAAIFFMRVLVSVSLAILLILTTRHHVLLKVLRIFKVPQLFVMTMGMTYRYIYLLLDGVQNTFIAIKSRVGFVTSTSNGRKMVASNMAGLWIKSYRLQTQVYYAMLSRGYTGEPRVLKDFSARSTDFVFLAFSIATLIGILWQNQFLL